MTTENRKKKVNKDFPFIIILFAQADPTFQLYSLEKINNLSLE